jgi:hypothetical protein
VDERLNIVGHGQLMNLTLDDVPWLTRAFISLMNGQGSSASYQIKNVSVVHLTGPNFNVYLRAEDWLKIAPYLADGTFSLDVLAPDADVYNKVYGVLSSLFTTSFPTTNI